MLFIQSRANLLQSASIRSGPFAAEIIAKRESTAVMDEQTITISHSLT